MAAQGKYLSHDYTKYVEEGDNGTPYKHGEGYCDPNELTNGLEAHHSLYTTRGEEGEEDAPFEYDNGYCDPNELPIDPREAQGKYLSHDDTEYVEEGDKDAPCKLEEGYCDPKELVIKNKETYHAPYTPRDEEGEEDAPFEYDVDPKDSVINWVEAHDELNTMHVEGGKADAPSEYEEGCRSFQGYESFDAFEEEHRLFRQGKDWKQSPPSTSGHDLDTPVPQPFFVDNDLAVYVGAAAGLSRKLSIDIATELTKAVIDFLQEGTVSGQTDYRLKTIHPKGNKKAFTWQVGSAGSLSQEQKTSKWRLRLDHTDDRWSARWENLTIFMHTAIGLICWTRATQGYSASFLSEHIETMSDVREKLRTAIATQLKAGRGSKYSIQSDLKPSFETRNDMQSSTGSVHWTLTGPAGTTTETLLLSEFTM